jgi:hypothetical protein
MRRITITFKQEDKELVACTVDFGNRDEASALENKLADTCQALIATVLKDLPADLLGEGYGSTQQEAEQLAKWTRNLPFCKTRIILQDLGRRFRILPIA